MPVSCAVTSLLCSLISSIVSCIIAYHYACWRMDKISKEDRAKMFANVPEFKRAA